MPLEVALPDGEPQGLEVGLCAAAVHDAAATVVAATGGGSLPPGGSTPVLNAARGRHRHLRVVCVAARRKVPPRVKTADAVGWELGQDLVAHLELDRRPKGVADG